MSLLIINHVGSEQERYYFHIKPLTPIYIGRAPNCDIVLPSATISRRHAVMIERNNMCDIKDFGSINGTYVNGQRVVGSQSLRFGEIIRIGDYTLEYARTKGSSTVRLKHFDETGPATLNKSGESAPEGKTDSRRSRHSRRQRTASQPQSLPDKKPVPDEIEQQLREAINNPPQAKPTPPPEQRHESHDSSSVWLEEKTIEEPLDNAGTPDVSSPEPAAPTAEIGDNAERENYLELENMPLQAAAAIKTPATEPAIPQAAAMEEKTSVLLHNAEQEKAGAIPAREEKTADTHSPRPASPPRPDSQAAVSRPAADESIDSEANEQEKTAKEAANQKAAAEAGLIGEFTPDLEEDAGAQESASDTKTFFDKIPLTASFRQAIESRLSMYSLLADMANERKALLEKPDLPDNVKGELERQERELGKLPSAAKALEMVDKRAAKRTALEEKIKEAKEAGQPVPPRPSKMMREAEEMAESQWLIIAQSEEETLPVVYEEAFTMALEEPLTPILQKAGIECKALMAGGIYYLALERILEETQKKRQDIRAQLNQATASHANKSGFSLFGRGNDDEDEEEQDSGLSIESLTQQDAALGQYIAGISQEMADLEKKLISEFWKVYEETAVVFLPQEESMDFAVRAFLRHGAIGSKPWWLKEDVKEHLLWDCNSDVLGKEARNLAPTQLFYADEYLAAVLNLQITPALDENLELNERNSPNWKADKALRKLIYSRRQIMRLTELLTTLDKQVERLAKERDSFDERLKKVLHGMRNEKSIRRDLQQQQQALRVSISKVVKLKEKLQSETLVQLQETVQDTEKRFESGELAMPGQEFLIRRECGAVHRIARLLANLKERFLPLVVREYKIGTGAMNDRMALNGEIANLERRDPGIFLEPIIPAKKKKDRVELHISPTIIIMPSPGLLCFSWNPRGGPEDGKPAVPTCFIRPRLRERQMTYLFSDFRWDTSKAGAGMDVMMSDTIVAAFMAVRWDWRKRSKEAREKGLVFTDQNDRTNWRRVYEAYIQTAFDGGEKLYNRNYDFYARIIGKYFELPEGTVLLKK